MAEIPPVIRGAFDLAPAEAIRFLDAKGYRTSIDWTDTFNDEHDASFTVAKIARVDLLRTIHVSLLDAQANGTPFEAWAKGLQPELEAAGWWGSVRDPELTGTGRLVRVTPRRLKTIYSTNLRMARATALWQRIEAGKAAMPYLRYSAVLDGRTRPQHRAWHNLVLPVDDPWWRTHFPPNGWNCRCTVVQMSERDLTRRKLTVAQAAPDDGPATAFRRKGSGETTLVPPGIDPGFAYNPGTARRVAIADKVAGSLAEAGSVPGVLAPAALRELLSEVPAARLTPTTLASIAGLATAGELAELAALLVTLLA